MFLDLIFPKFCLSCGACGEYACDKCFNTLIVPCGPLKCPRGAFFDKLIACFKYDKSNFLRKLIARFKYKGAESLTVIFAELMVGAFLKYHDISMDYIVVPVPMHRAKKQKRGFNQAERLAFLVANDLNYPCIDVLEKSVDTENQSHLGRDERLSNVTGSFSLNNSCTCAFGKNVILIDDVATTLSTLNECSKVLRYGGAESITCLVLARAMPIGLNSGYENWD